MTADIVDDAAPPPDELMSIDELAAATGLTVRTTRYYASLGLIPSPIRRGRLAWYDAAHRARLELVRALQDHGFTLQAIERYVASVPPEASVEDLALQRAMLTSWTSEAPERLTARALDKRAGRRLDADDLRLLVRLGLLDSVEGGFLVSPHLRIGLELLDLDIPRESMGEAGDAIERHMTALADELTDILRSQVLAPYRSTHGREDAARLEETVPRLRQLTLEAVVAAFQRAANAVITRSLSRE